MVWISLFQYAPGGELFDYIVAKDRLKVEYKLDCSTMFYC